MHQLCLHSPAVLLLRYCLAPGLLYLCWGCTWSCNKHGFDYGASHFFQLTSNQFRERRYLDHLDTNRRTSSNSNSYRNRSIFTMCLSQRYHRVLQFHLPRIHVHGALIPGPMRLLHQQHMGPRQVRQICILVRGICENRTA